MDRLKEVPILHINTAKTWRGGERQTFYLISNLNNRGFLCYCICQKESQLQEKLIENDLPHFAVRMRCELDLIAAKKIAQISKRINAKILHMHTAHAHSLGFISNLFNNIPINIVSRRVDFRIKKNS